MFGLSYEYKVGTNPQAESLYNKTLYRLSLKFSTQFLSQGYNKRSWDTSQLDCIAPC